MCRPVKKTYTTDDTYHYSGSKGESEEHTISQKTLEEREDPLYFMSFWVREFISEFQRQSLPFPGG